MELWVPTEALNWVAREDTDEREIFKQRPEEDKELCHAYAWGQSANLSNVVLVNNGVVSYVSSIDELYNCWKQTADWISLSIYIYNKESNFYLWGYLWCHFGKKIWKKRGWERKRRAGRGRMNRSFNKRRKSLGWDRETFSLEGQRVNISGFLDQNGALSQLFNPAFIV